MMGVLGRLDDFALGAYLVYRYLRAAKKIGAQEKAYQAEQSSPKSGVGKDAEQDPHTVLGVEVEAEGKEIREAYRQKMAEYHPDKVRHLGTELQALAHEKSLAIQRAYEELKRRGRCE